METLPKELLLYLSSFLPLSDLVTIGQVNRGWRRIAKDPSFWRHVEVSTLPLKKKLGFLRFFGYLAGLWEDLVSTETLLQVTRGKGGRWLEFVPRLYRVEKKGERQLIFTSNRIEFRYEYFKGLPWLRDGFFLLWVCVWRMEGVANVKKVLIGQNRGKKFKKVLWKCTHSPLDRPSLQRHFDVSVVLHWQRCSAFDFTVTLLDIVMTTVYVKFTLKLHHQEVKMMNLRMNHGWISSFLGPLYKSIRKCGSRSIPYSFPGCFVTFYWCNYWCKILTDQV